MLHPFKYGLRNGIVAQAAAYTTKKSNFYFICTVTQYRSGLISLRKFNAYTSIKLIKDHIQIVTVQKYNLIFQLHKLFMQI